jgi:hypothetical protein
LEAKCIYNSSRSECHYIFSQLPFLTLGDERIVRESEIVLELQPAALLSTNDDRRREDHVRSLERALPQELSLRPLLYFPGEMVSFGDKVLDKSVFC